MDHPQIEWLGDAAILLRFGDRIDAAINERVLAAAQALRVARIRGVVDIVPAYASLALHLDPDVAACGADETLERIARTLQAPQSLVPRGPARCVRIPVAYGGELGPDLALVAQHCGLDEAAVVACHTAVEYRVAMLGFQPGFPYLLGLDPALAMPRRAQPRTSVAAGSVAIGGLQTGIYPANAPGGWNLIGRTGVRLFDPRREPPTLLAPGDRVRFVAVAPAELPEATVSIVA
jgi:KipI family sensor histidine kinase inhibitor